MLGDSDDKGTCLVYTTCSCGQFQNVAKRRALGNGAEFSLDALLRVAATGSRVFLSGSVRIVNQREDYFRLISQLLLVIPFMVLDLSSMCIPCHCRACEACSLHFASRVSVLFEGFSSWLCCSLAFWFSLCSGWFSS